MKKFFLLLTILTVLGFYFHTLFYPIKLFDEITPFKETFLPVATSLDELLELISKLGIFQHLEATNTLYTNITSVRCNPVDNIIKLFIQLIFQKNVFLYRAYNLFLHTINTALIFLILNKISTFLIKEKTGYFITFMLTLLWALHPVNIESVLLLTNNILCYTFSILVIYFYLTFLLNDPLQEKFSMSKNLILFFLYTLSIFTSEYVFMVPFILIAYSTVLFAHFNPKTKNLLQSFHVAFRLNIPLLVGFVLFLLYFLLSDTRINLLNQHSLPAALERIFWLAPQVIFHLTSLVLFPKTLSIDGTSIIKLGNILYDPYAIFCIIFLVLTLLLAIISLLQAKRNFPFVFTLSFLFLLSIVPFSHILSPLYNLASERYLYLPSFILIFGTSHWIYLFALQVNANNVRQKAGDAGREESSTSSAGASDGGLSEGGRTRAGYHPPNHSMSRINTTFYSSATITCLAILVILASFRSLVRTLEWKDTFTLYSSAIKATKNHIYKALRYKGLISNDKVLVKYPEYTTEKKYIKLALKHLKLGIKELIKKEKQYQKLTPLVIKSYGLDPSSLLAKAGYILSQTDFVLNQDPKHALELIEPFTKHITAFDSAASSFYAALLFYNGNLSKSEKVLRTLHKKYPYSTKITFPLCDLIYIKNKDLNEIENLVLNVFKYFPYDTYTLYALSRIYKEKKELDKYAYYTYLAALRGHSIEGLKEAYNAYSVIKNTNKTDKIKKIITKLHKKRVKEKNV